MPPGGAIVDSDGVNILDGLGGGNPFNQSLNTTDGVQFANIQLGGSLNYSDSANLISVEDKDGFGQVLFQNKNSGANASMNIVLVNDSQGTDYMAIGVNSSTFSPLYNTLFELPKKIETPYLSTSFQLNQPKFILEKYSKYNIVNI